MHASGGSPGNPAVRRAKSTWGRGQSYLAKQLPYKLYSIKANEWNFLVKKYREYPQKVTKNDFFSSILSTVLFVSLLGDDLHRVGIKYIYKV